MCGAVNCAWQGRRRRCTRAPAASFPQGEKGVARLPALQWVAWSQPCRGTEPSGANESAWQAWRGGLASMGKQGPGAQDGEPCMGVSSTPLRPVRWALLSRSTRRCLCACAGAGTGGWSLGGLLSSAASYLNPMAYLRGSPLVVGEAAEEQAQGSGVAGGCGVRWVRRQRWAAPGMRRVRRCTMRGTPLWHS